MYALIALLATWVIFFPIVNRAVYPSARMQVERYEQEADIELGREANNLKLDVASDAMQLSGCFVGEICEEGTPFIGPEDHFSRFGCNLTEIDEGGWIIMKCAYENPEIQGTFDMQPWIEEFEDGSFILHALMPFEVNPQRLR